MFVAFMSLHILLFSVWKWYFKFESKWFEFIKDFENGKLNPNRIKG
jgi:hypothetical protein